MNNPKTDKGVQYWKQRCELAEANLNTKKTNLMAEWADSQSKILWYKEMYEEKNAQLTTSLLEWVDTQATIMKAIPIEDIKEFINSKKI